MALVFTGDEFADGGAFISNTLQQHKVKASFFFTGRFYRNKKFRSLINKLKNNGHYLGPHSNEHLLYADWKKRDSLLVSKQQFKTDLLNNYAAMNTFGIAKKKAAFFLPPYEWYNDSIAAWTKELGSTLINYTPGTLSHADYTTPDATNYRDSKTIYNSIINYERRSTSGLNGFILLMHIGTDAKRKDPFYTMLPQLLQWLYSNGYKLVKIDTLLKDGL
ncbi:MAG TPA: polysaccharide deacetylase family protein [Chitinophagaceae bacterium]|nr:polysaccharide deacetylase family protein [Chitinophagaceae bacterium]